MRTRTTFLWQYEASSRTLCKLSYRDPLKGKSCATRANQIVDMSLPLSQMCLILIWQKTTYMSKMLIFRENCCTSKNILDKHKTNDADIIAYIHSFLLNCILVFISFHLMYYMTILSVKCWKYKFLYFYMPAILF